MAVALQIIQMVLPVIIMIGIGYLCNRRQLVTEQGIEGIKSVISNITLPVVLFNAFFTATYDIKLLIVFLVVFGCCSIALLIGLKSRGLVRPYDKFYPFLMTSFEGGMLGYALYGLLVGQQYISQFAVVDIGQTVFAYTVFLMILKSVNGESITGTGIIKNMVKSPPCIGMLLGIAGGLCGLHSLMAESVWREVLNETVTFISQPTACLILIVMGYQLCFKRELLRPVVVTIIARMVVMGVLCTVASSLIFMFIPFDRNLLFALILMFSLPAPFIIPLFADVEEHGEYIGVTLSIYTLVTIGIFIILSICITTYSIV